VTSRAATGVTAGATTGATASATTASTATQASLQLAQLRIEPATPKNRQVQVLISGRVVAQNQVAISTEVPGRMLPTQVPFKAGATFKQGAVLVQLDAREFELNLESQKSAFLNTLTGLLPDLKEDYPQSFAPWQAYVQQYQAGSTLAALPPTQTNAERYFITARGVYTAFYAIKAQEERLRKHAVTAPYNGMITQTQTSVGAMVAPGQPLGTMISLEGFELEAGVSLSTASKLSVGQVLTFSSNELAGTFQGRVVRINGVVDPKTQNVPVFFSLSGRGLKPGMYLEGRLDLETFEQVVALPTTALQKDQSVLVLQNGTIAKKTVQPVAYRQDSVWLTGLLPQDSLITNTFEQPVVGLTVGK